MNRGCLTGLLVVLLIAAGSGCQRDGDPADWLARVQHANTVADQALASGDLETALTTLESVYESDVPEAISAVDSRVIRQDLCYRLADIALIENDPESALAWADNGLELGAVDDLFNANLHLIRGRALEALDREIDAVGAYVEALRINHVLLDGVMNAMEEETRE